MKKNKSKLAKAVLEYHEALKLCLEDPKKMSSFCTIQDESLDDLYFKMVDLAESENYGND